MAQFNNNNPGNIRKSATTWQGEISSTTPFERFSSETYGWRALLKNLQAYIKTGQNTIWTIIHKWAPFGDGNNNPDNYSWKVSQYSGIPINERLSVNDYAKLSKIAAVIATVESGQPLTAPNYNSLNQAAYNLRQEQYATGGTGTTQPAATGNVWDQITGMLTTTPTTPTQPATMPGYSPTNQQEMAPYQYDQKEPRKIWPWIVGGGVLLAGGIYLATRKPKKTRTRKKKR